MNEETKICSKCGKEKPLRFFWSAGYGKKKTTCIECCKIMRAQNLLKKRLIEPRKKKVYNQTLCWSCKNAVGRCSWSEVDESKKNRPIKYEPVNGWVAVKTERGDYNSYVVLSCPEFVPDDNYGGNFYE